MLRILSIFGCLLFTIVTSSSAQDSSLSPADSLLVTTLPQYEVAPVVVTAIRAPRPALRVPYGTSVIDVDFRKRAERNLSVDELLRPVPGLIVSNRHNLAQGDRISLRGLGSRTPFGVRGIRIFLDGIPLTMPDGQSQLNNLDLASVGRIEVLRGPSSSLYGNAAGGVIDIHSEAHSREKLRLQSELLTGAFGLRRTQLKLSGKIGSHGYLLSGGHLRLRGFREHAEAQSTFINAIGQHHLASRLHLTSVINFHDSPFLLNPSSLSKTDAVSLPAHTRTFVRQQGAGKRVRQGQGGATLAWHGDDWRWQSTVYGLQRALFNPIPGRIIDLDRTGAGLRTVYTRRWASPSTGRAVQLTTGVDYERMDDQRREFENLGLPPNQTSSLNGSDILDAVRAGVLLVDQQEKVAGAGPFGELEITPGYQWIFTAGLRYDRYLYSVENRLTPGDDRASDKRHMAHLSPMLGISFRLQPQMTLYANLATAFQTPTTTELGNSPGRQGGLNQDLQPERIRSYELGWKSSWPGKKIDLDAALYRLQISDMLIPYQIGDSQSEEVFFRNAGRAHNLGLEMQATWLPAAGWRASLAYSRMDFRFDDFLLERPNSNSSEPVQLAGNRVPGVPPHRIHIALSYDSMPGLFGALDFEWVARYYANDFNGAPDANATPVQNFINDAYGTLNLRIGWQRRLGGAEVTIFSGLDNLFDVRYSGSIVPNAAGDRYFEPAPGRHWYLGGRIGIVP